MYRGKMKHIVIFIVMLLLGTAGGVYAETTSMMAKLSSEAADFKRLGLSEKNPEIWEDGQRLKDFSPGNFEWWYIDGIFNDGKMMVASFHFRVSGSGTMYPILNLLITDNEKDICDMHVSGWGKAINTTKDRCDVRIGEHYLKSLKGLERYELYIDPATNKGFGAHLFLERSVPSYRPGTGHWEAGEKLFAWFCAVPGGKMKGTLFFDGKQVNVEGSGYHDHNWGNVPMNHMIRGWVWGRSNVDDIAVVAANVYFNETHGSVETPLLYVTKGNSVILSAIKNELSYLQGGKFQHPYIGKMITNDSIFMVKGIDRAQIRFIGNRPIKTSMGYMRFASTTTIDVDHNGWKINTKGSSIFENMNFYGWRE